MARLADRPSVHAGQGELHLEVILIEKAEADRCCISDVSHVILQTESGQCYATELNGIGRSVWGVWRGPNAVATIQRPVYVFHKACKKILSLPSHGVEFCIVEIGKKRRLEV